MKAAPAVQVDVRHFGVWNGLLTVTSLAAMWTSGAWFASRNDELPAWGGWLIGLALLTALLGVSMSLRRHPIRLRWDTQRWYLTEVNRRSEEIGPAQVRVMIDAGGWLLLKFVQDARSTPRSVHWVPVQREDVEAQWHGLRCAVFAPRIQMHSSVGRGGSIRIE
ncbi:MAG: hypothetical protein QFE16_11015 [Pseudomonadota bacterium]|nr:hypothetical protein [Pseudomonadota bacterium]